MISNVYSISYKENNKVERDLVEAPDIKFAVNRYSETYPERLILAITYQSKILV